MNNEKVYLKGYVVGHTADTLGYKGLQIQLENMDIVEIDKNLVYKITDEPQPIKLKDIIARIKNFDSGTQKVWLNEILNELGSDYGTLKYKAGYEQGKVEGLIEREKVIVPQFVADWITKAKTEGLKRKNSLGSYEELSPSDSAYSAMFSIFIKGFAIGEVRNWVAENTDTFALAWINGYEVEKEKLYTVKMRATKQPLFYNNMYEKIFFSLGELATRFTRKELEEAGLGEVFNSSLFEVEEVGE
nr:MAG TPA: Protein of unknown function (DUF1642) [Caudoviricetes sp.]